MKRIKSLLTGLSQEHLTNLGQERSQLKIHHDALKDFTRLCESALKDGIKIWPVSIFRSFEHQKQIWNRKATGKTVLLDDKSNPLNYTDLSEEEIIWAILRWSALPGMSRHHWGTDLDVIDANALPSPDYQIQLTPSEFAEDGPFYKLDQWLNRKIEKNQSFGFFRPYERDLGGVAPEAWHLSYAPIAKGLLQNLSFKCFEYLISSEIYEQVELKDVIFSHREEIYSRYIKNICN